MFTEIVILFSLILRAACEASRISWQVGTIFAMNYHVCFSFVNKKNTIFILYDPTRGNHVTQVLGQERAKDLSH